MKNITRILLAVAMLAGCKSELNESSSIPPTVPPKPLCVTSAVTGHMRVTAEEGNLFLTTAEGRKIQLTDTKRDSDPSLSVDHKQVVFIRRPRQPVLFGKNGDDRDATELWIIQSDGKGSRKLLDGTDGPYEVLHGGFSSPQFSSDGRQVFFLCNKAAVTKVVVATSVKRPAPRGVTEGNSLEVIHNGLYRDMLIIRVHKYWIAGGSYDWYWLFSANGKEFGPIGPDEQNLVDYKNLYEAWGDDETPTLHPKTQLPQTEPPPLTPPKERQ